MMALPNGKSRITVLVIIIGALVLIGVLVFFLLFNNSQRSNQTTTTSESDQPEVNPKISPNILASENMGQYLGKSEEYNLENIQGTPNKSMFPDIENPKFKLSSEEKNLIGSDIVASFNIGNDYRAYPLKYLLFHHLVNDKFGSTPVLISYCGICNSAAAYNPTVKGKTLSFGVLGTLYRNNLVMYDKNTDSWWVQITGEAISGEYKGNKLNILPGMELLKFSDFKKSNPKGRVLQPVAKYESSYDQFDPNEFYEQDDNLGNKDQVLGVEVRGETKAYKIADIKKKSVINDIINGWSLLVFSNPENNGLGVFRRFLNDKELVLEFKLEKDILIDKETGSKWNFNGEAIEGKLKGNILEKPKYLELYLFAWEGFYPNTKIFHP